MTSLYNAFVVNVNAALEAKGWTRSDLAEAMGVTKGNLTQQLNGHRSVGLEVVERYAKALGVKDPAHLLRQPKNLAKAS